MSNDFKRVFIAFDAPEGFKKIYKEKFYPVFSNIEELKAVIPENIHITLKFLGCTSGSKISQIKDVLACLLNQEREIEVSFTGISAFPNVRKPRVIWAGFEDKNRIMRKIAGKIDLAMSKLGYEKERRSFKPHITIARVKKGKMFNLDSFMQNYRNDKMLVENFKINMIAFYESILKQEGPVYKILQSYPLKNL